MAIGWTRTLNGSLACLCCLFSIWCSGRINDLRNNYRKAGFLFTNLSIPSCNEFQMAGALGEGTGSLEMAFLLQSDSRPRTRQPSLRHSCLYKLLDPVPVCLKPFSFSVQMFLRVSNLYSFEKIISVFHAIGFLCFLGSPPFLIVAERPVPSSDITNGM